MMASHGAEQSTIASIKKFDTYVYCGGLAKYQSLEMGVSVRVVPLVRVVRSQEDHWSMSLSRAMSGSGSVADGEELED